MIRRSTVIATAAILLSLLVHLLGLNFISGGQPEQSANDAATDVVTMGNTFEDVAETFSVPVPPETAPVPDPPVEVPPEPDLADMPTSEALVASENPQNVLSPGTGKESVAPPDTTGPSEPEAAGTPEPETVAPSGGDAGTAAETAVTQPIETDATAEALEGDPDADAEPIEAVVAQLAPQAGAPETLEATVVPEDSQIAEVEDEPDGSDLAVVTSLRPQLPTRLPSAAPRGLPRESSEFSELLSPPLIESPLAAYQRSGTDPSIRQNGAAQSGGLGFVDSGGTGNSDVTNYAGRVLVHLNRTPPVPVSGRGYARVFFEINPDGSLAWVNIIDGTGSPEINRAAKEQVRVAAPFPPPPKRARRKLVFVYRIN